jgi:hypothetical protein
VIPLRHSVLVKAVRPQLGGGRMALVDSRVCRRCAGTAILLPVRRKMHSDPDDEPYRYQWLYKNPDLPKDKTT